MFISPAFAQEAAAAAPQAFSFSSFVPLIAIFAIFYFLIIRPQSKKMKEQQEMVNSLKTGYKVVTNSGIVGVVTEVLEKENQIEIEISEGVKVKFLKQYVTELLKKEEAKKATKADKKSAAKKTTAKKIEAKKPAAKKTEAKKTEDKK